MINKLLIANRGEIAIRIMRACRELGIKTVAVYSSADKNAQHVQFADEAILLGEAAPKESYLNVDKLIRAALDSKADAIHPGYGFLSENGSFAAAVESANLAFIGPSADSIRAMGDKAESKIMMKAAGVPTVPGFEGLESIDEFKKAAQEIGYPVLVKAAAGGGGAGHHLPRPDRLGLAYLRGVDADDGGLHGALRHRRAGWPAQRRWHRLPGSQVVEAGPSGSYPHLHLRNHRERRESDPRPLGHHPQSQRGV